MLDKDNLCFSWCDKIDALRCSKGVDGKKQIALAFVVYHLTAALLT